MPNRHRTERATTVVELRPRTRRGGRGGNPVLRELGARLRAMREARGLSVAELARRAELGAGELELLERGELDPDWVSVTLLAEALGEPAASLCG